MTGFSDMLTEVVAGSTIEAKAHFILPIELDTDNASAAYGVLDADAIVWTQGVVSTLTVLPLSPTESQVEVLSTIEIPENIPVESLGTKYQVRWLLLLADGSKHISNDYITIIPRIEGEVGVLDAVELENTTATIQAVLPDEGPASLVIYQENTQVYQQSEIDPLGSSYLGYEYSHTLDLTTNINIIPQLTPYTTVWSYGTPALREVGRMFVVTPAILDALKELNTYLNRLNRKARLEELVFTTSDLMSFLKGGADMFNGTDFFTSITFTNAQGSYRHHWMVCSQIVALRTRYLEEGESSFDFSGQAVQLNVDITTYIETQLSALESWRDNNLPSFKKQLHKRGLMTGDGSKVGYISRTRGVMGLTMNPVSGIGLSRGNFRLR